MEAVQKRIGVKYHPETHSRKLHTEIGNIAV